ncbi:hypothetical protein [Vacuolonema iberomarrocanum]|uniref:hypothetical protein n=1 Tax=Vacuolonema iberomarrocanum TaxID=3454632 RepID=UPI0019DBFF99|nr:hypothetical protein [filamentous cyanobacterium LEGE 07170]
MKAEIKKRLVRLPAKVMARYLAFQQECEDEHSRHYEWALRWNGINIEHLPTGNDITIGWFF